VRALAVSASGEPHRLSDPQLEELTRRIAAGLHVRGIGAGDVVLVRLPKGAEWLCLLRALYRVGAVALPCVEQVTAVELAERSQLTEARLQVLEPADIPLADGPAPVADLAPDAPGFLIFTSGTEGRPKAAVHPRRYLEANRLQLERWMGVRAGDRVWCTAAPGWSKSVRNVWFPAELYDCETVLHAGRFDAAERLELLAALQPQVLCMSPTEYRLCAKAATFGSHDLGGVRGEERAGQVDSAHKRSISAKNSRWSPVRAGQSRMKYLSCRLSPVHWKTFRTSCTSSSVRPCGATARTRLEWQQ